jgi:hypothetical protein
MKLTDPVIRINGFNVICLGAGRNREEYSPEEIKRGIKKNRLKVCKYKDLKTGRGAGEKLPNSEGQGSKL